jgi:hypothetical protein
MMKATLATLSLALLTLVVTMACKSANLGPVFPVDDLGAYDLVVIATVTDAVHSRKAYQGLESFNVTIKECLKGDLDAGVNISGKAKDEEPHAVCPVHLSVGDDYLLLLTEPLAGYRLSRFSFPVKKGHVYFDDYILQIKKGLSSVKDK